MPDIALILGPILFRDFEVPSTINFGGRQRLVVHRLPGGERVIDALGQDDAQISFAGIFTGPDATMRARELDELRIAGVVLPLTWDVFFYNVIIHDLYLDYRNGCWIPFRAVCTVLQDEAAMPLPLTVSLASSVAQDIAAASEYAAAGGVDMSPLSAALAMPDATTRGSGSFASMQSNIIWMQSTLGAEIATASSVVACADLTGGASASDGAAALLAATDSTGQLSSLVTANSYLGRLSANLVSAGT